MSDEHVNGKDDEDNTDDAAVHGGSRSKKYAKRRFSPEDAPKLLRDSGCDPSVWPTRYQYKRWFKYIIKSLPADPEGAWFAVCPIKNRFMPAGNIRKPTAIVNFGLGIFRCLHDEPCHGKARSMSISRMDQQLLELLDDGTIGRILMEREDGHGVDDS